MQKKKYIELYKLIRFFLEKIIYSNIIILPYMSALFSKKFTSKSVVTSYIFNNWFVKKDSPAVNFRSIPAKNTSEIIFGGNFVIPNDELDKFYYFSLNNLSQFCFVELRTEFYKLFFDIDVNIHVDNMSKFMKYICETINKVLSHYISGEKNIFEFILCKKENYAGKLHIIFPNLIVDQKHAKLLHNCIINRLVKEDKFNLTRNDYEKIVDKNVCNNKSSLRVIYQNRIDKSTNKLAYYEIDYKRSTYECKNENPFEVTSIRSNKTSINFKLVEEASIPIMNFVVDKHVFKQHINKEEVIFIPNSYNEEFIKDLSDNLNQERIDNYDTWISLMLLYRNYELKELAHYISLKSVKYDNEEIEKIFMRKPKNHKLEHY